MVQIANSCVKNKNNESFNKYVKNIFIELLISTSIKRKERYDVCLQKRSGHILMILKREISGVGIVPAGSCLERSP